MTLHQSSEKPRVLIAFSRKAHSTLSKAFDRSVLIAMCSREHLMLEMSACSSSCAIKMLSDISLSSTKAACVLVIIPGRIFFRCLLKSLETTL